jgi:hypothetical protein
MRRKGRVTHAEPTSNYVHGDGVRVWSEVFTAYITLCAWRHSPTLYNCDIHHSVETEVTEVECKGG